MFSVKLLHKRLEKIQRPLAVVVGSALSVTRGSPNLGVPGVSEMVERIRRRMVDEDLDEDFDEALREGTGNRYQQAFAFVQSTQGAEVCDAIIREAVLEARLPDAPPLRHGDGDPAHWHLPRGTVALGRLLATKDPRFTGPILTTNFDPLLSMAIEHVGGVVDRRVLERDGHLPGAGDSNHGARVVHLHGYWRGSTLHLPQHLSAPRDKLLGSLRELLSGHVVLVVGYGGWEDAFMQALSQVIDQPETPVNVLWCMYGDEGTARHDNRNLLRRFEGYRDFVPYFGVDAHQLFEDLARSGGARATGGGGTRSRTETGAGITAPSEGPVRVAKVLTPKMREELDPLERWRSEYPRPAVRTGSFKRRGVETVDGELIVHEQTGIELVRIPAGMFLMGTTAGDRRGLDDERPQHEVTLRAFCLARTQVTNAQYRRFLAANPDAPKPEFWADRRYNQPDQPVVGVSWDDAKEYCDWAGLLLPTEAQWEYACRAGRPTQYWSGDEESDLARVGWYRENSDGRLHVVGEKEANPFGLYDMHGNVWEWCRDKWDSYKARPQPGDGLRHSPVGEGSRVVRGGSWSYVAGLARSAYRGDWLSGHRADNLGLRPVYVP